MFKVSHMPSFKYMLDELYAGRNATAVCQDGVGFVDMSRREGMIHRSRDLLKFSHIGHTISVLRAFFGRSA